MNRLQGKVAIITGGASGVGEAISKLFAEEGATVAIFDLKGAGLAEKINKQGAAAKFYEVDVSKEHIVKAAVEDVAKTFGKVDILVNDAGISGVNKPTHLIESEEWDETFNVNVKGVFFCTKHVLPYMEQNGCGSIVNMSSVYGTHGTRGDLSSYHATKGAVTAMTKQDAVTYGKKNIRVNAIHPGAIVTPLLKEVADTLEGGFEAFDARVSRRHPVGHLGEPKDIAYGALYLASDEAKFVTGISLYIDGGYTAW